MRHGLLVYRAQLRDAQLAQWRHASLVYALLAPWQSKDGRTDPPEIPDLLTSE